jgi:hypothetical protein
MPETNQSDKRDASDTTPHDAQNQVLLPDTHQDEYLRKVADEVWKLWRAELRREQERTPDRWRRK